MNVCVCALSDRNTPFCHTESATQIISDPCQFFSNGMLIPDVWNADVFHWKNSLDFSTFWCFFTVQFCGKNPGAPGPDSQTTGGRDGLQDHGARQKLHERQEEGKT